MGSREDVQRRGNWEVCRESREDWCRGGVTGKCVESETEGGGLVQRRGKWEVCREWGQGRRTGAEEG